MNFWEDTKIGRVLALAIVLSAYLGLLMVAFVMSLFRRKNVSP